MIATRCARSAAIRPMPRSVSSGRSPAVPMIAVIGAARPAAPAGDPLGDVEHRRDAGLVVGEVDDDDPRPEPEQVEPARASARRSARKSMQPVAHLARCVAPRPARAAGGGQRVGDVVAGQAADRDRDAGDVDDLVSRVAPFASTSDPVDGRGRRARRARDGGATTADASPSSEK